MLVQQIETLASRRGEIEELCYTKILVSFLKILKFNRISLFYYLNKNGVPFGSLAQNVTVNTTNGCKTVDSNSFLFTAAIKSDFEKSAKFS